MAQANVIRLPREWSKPCPGRDALKRGERRFVSDKPCPRCGSHNRYAASSACVECTRKRSIAAREPVEPAAVAIIEKAASDVWTWAGSPADDTLLALRVLIASLFCGASASRIAASTNMGHTKVFTLASRLRAGGIWPERGPVPAFVQDAWFSERDGNMALLLDAMVATGDLVRDPEIGRYASSKRAEK